MIFELAKNHQELPISDLELKEYLNYNPHHNRYTAKQNFPGRSPNETDRGGWRGYDRVYSKYFLPIKHEKITMLEIGIHYGYGLLAWQRYFKKATIHGLDNVIDESRILEYNKINEDFPEYLKVKKHFFNSTVADDWLTFYKRPFDIIIDDGGHHPETQIKTFECAWPYLKSGGLYFIEDVSHRYGEDQLNNLADMLEQIKEEGHFIEIFSHNNTGLEHILSRPELRKRYQISSQAGTSSEEYIVAITKL